MTRTLTAVTFLLLCITVLAVPIHHGKVVHITDGDTLKILVKGRMLKIRLAEIDTPEKGQPFGTKAKKALARMAFNKQARVVEVTKDRYKRIVGRVYVDNLYVTPNWSGRATPGYTGSMPGIKTCTGWRRRHRRPSADYGPVTTLYGHGSGDGGKGR